MTTAKAYAALIGAIATALLGVFASDTEVGQVLTVVSVIATAYATYRVPNQAAPRRRNTAGLVAWQAVALGVIVGGVILWLLSIAVKAV